MPSPPENEIRQTAEAALDAFWAAVAQRFPNATSGDLSPHSHSTLQRAAEQAIADWMALNT